MPISADGTFIASEMAGDGRKVVLIDAAGHFRANSQAAELGDLLERDVAVVRYDRRGRGESTDTLPYAPAREVEDLAAVVDEVGGPVSLYGYSSGCLVAIHAAAAGLNVRSLVLFEPPLQLEPADHEFTRQLHQRRGADAVRFFLAAIGAPADHLDDAMVSVGHTLVYDSMLSDATDAELLRRVAVPTLLLSSAGSSDDLTGMTAAAKELLPHAEHHSLPGEWHGVAATVLAPVISDFLRR